jgi:cyclophilin family peptidyl-prolyl cis-trans isomerase
MICRPFFKRFQGRASKGKSAKRGVNRIKGLHRHPCFEPLESRHLLSITFPTTISAQTVLAGAPLNLALDVASDTGNAITYTIALSNVSLTDADGNAVELTAAIPTGNPSMKITVSDSADGISGDMILQLFQDLAPKTVDRIMTLVNEGYYDDLTFHRVIENFMIQGGAGDDTASFDDEFVSSLQFTGSGILAMANSGDDSNTSQFFITVESTRWLDFEHTIFGMLTEGDDILDQISTVSTDSNDKPVNDVVMTSVTIFYDTENGVLRLSAPNGATGTADVTITATDSVTDEYVTQTFSVTVEADTTNNDPYLGDIDPIQTTQDTAVTVTIPATDVEGDSIYYTAALSTANSNLAVSVNSATGELTVTPSNGITGVYSVLVTVSTSSDGDACDSQTVPIYISPAAPTGIQLLSTSDTGANTADGLTNLNNTSGNTLQFQVSGVVSDALVELYADGVLIGSATASDTTVTVATNGTATLTDGEHTITAKQTLADQAVEVGNLDTTVDLASTLSSAITINVETTVPQFDFTPGTTAVVAVPYSCQAVATDESSDTLTYQLSVYPTDMAIDSSTGLITWTPDEDQVGETELTVQAVDSAGNIGSYSYTINVLASNAAPELDPKSPVMGATDEDTVISVNLTDFINSGSATTTITDSDEDAVVGGIAVIDYSGYGIWEYSLDGTTFYSIGDVSPSSALLLAKDAMLRYTPNGKNGEAAFISFRAWDTTAGVNGGRVDISASDAIGGSTAYSSGTDIAVINVSSLNDAPVLDPAGPTMGCVATGGSLDISLTDTFINNGDDTTSITDVDDDATVGGIALIGVTGNGTWEFSTDGSTYTALGSVSETYALLLPSSAVLRYTAASDTSGETATITYRAWDATTGSAGDYPDASTNGGTTAFSTDTDTASLIVNDAPVLTAASPSLGSTDEDSAISISLTGTFINNGDDTTKIEDVNTTGAVGGIALIGVTGNGTWQYSINGSDLVNVGTVLASSALLLPANAVLQYTPDAENGETAAITYRAWDATSGSAGDYADTTTNGGATSFSVDTDTASLTVTDLNDAPVLVSAEPSLGSIVTGDSITVSLTGFINGDSGTTTITDVDNDTTVGGIAIVALTGNGTWKYSVDGSTYTDVGEVSYTSALLLERDASLYYVPGGADSETATITYRAWDATSYSAESYVDTTSNGGTTVFSTAADTASLTVNDAPALTAASPSLGSTDVDTAITISLSTFINNGDGATTITDVNTNNALGGIALIGIAGNGTWEYSTDGTTFTAVGEVSENAALLLPNTAVLRYTPDGDNAENPCITYRAWDVTSGSAGNYADTTTSGGATAFSANTDTASLTVNAVIATTGSISGYVYIDSNNDGLRFTSGGNAHLPLAGVALTLYMQNGSGGWEQTAAAVTAADGSYSFTGLAAGTYKIVESQSIYYLDGVETAGTVNGATRGTAGSDEITLDLQAGENAVEYNFGECGIKANYFSIRMLLGSYLSSLASLAQINSAPVVKLSAASANYSTTYTTGGSAVAIASDEAAIVDSDSAMFVSMTVTITNLLDSDYETLTVGVADTSLTTTYSHGKLTVSGPADLDTYLTVLKSITYSNTASSAQSGDRSITVAINDGIADSEPVTATIAVKLGSSVSSSSIAADDS